MSGKHTSMLSKIVQKEPAADEEQVREAIEQERQARTHPALLTVSFKNGDELLPAYSLLRYVWKRDGGSVWKLVFDDFDLVIRGRNLGEKLRKMLCHHRLSVLREGNLIEDELTAEDDLFIESIEIHEKEEA